MKRRKYDNPPSIDAANLTLVYVSFQQSAAAVQALQNAQALQAAQAAAIHQAAAAQAIMANGGNVPGPHGPNPHGPADHHLTAVQAVAAAHQAAHQAAAQANQQNANTVSD